MTDADRELKRLKLELELEQAKRLTEQERRLTEQERRLTEQEKRLTEQEKRLSKEAEVKIEMEKTRQLQLKSGVEGKPMSISTMPLTAFDNLVYHLELRLLNPDAPTIDPLKAPFVPYSWPADPSEKNETPKLNTHLSEHLQRLGVSIDQPGGYDVIPTHTKSVFWTKKMGTVTVRGSPDAVLVPHTVDPATCRREVRVAIEYKTPTYMTEKSEQQQTIQPVMELLMAQADSDYPVLVLFTDMASHFRVLHPGRDGILYYKNLSADQAFSMLVSHLQAPEGASKVFDKNAIPEDKKIAMHLIKDAVARTASTLEEQLEVLDELPVDEREDTARELWKQHLQASLYT